MRSAMAARIAGSRNAANDSPVRSSMWPIESVSACRFGFASTVPISGTNGRFREFQRPAASTAALAMQIRASTPAVHTSHLREPYASSSESCAAISKKIGK